jgi:hypothetical protein
MIFAWQIDSVPDWVRFFPQFNEFFSSLFSYLNIIFLLFGNIYSPFCVTAKVTKLIGLSPPLFLSPTNLVTFAGTQNGELILPKNLEMPSRGTQKFLVSKLMFQCVSVVVPFLFSVSFSHFKEK